MITSKFGGTAVTAQNLHCMKNVLTPAHRCVVVSAIGREHSRDDKVTDLLKSHFFGDGEAWGKICRKYRRLVEVNGIDVDVDKLLYSAERRARTYDLAYCMSLGEELSAKIVAQYLNAQYLEAESLIVFNGKHLAVQQTYKNIASAFSGLSCGVVGGFYGGLQQRSATQETLLSPQSVLQNLPCDTRPISPRQTFSRGGGDVSGAVFAAATNSTLYENWTDVYGVCLADPKSVSGVSTARNLSYNEMRILANAGAQVLHPQAVNYVQKRAIPIRIANYLNPHGESTLVSNCPSHLSLLLATETVQNGAYRTTVLFNLPTQKAVRLLGNLFDSLCAEDVAKSHSALQASRSNHRNSSSALSASTVVYSCNVSHNRAEILTSQSVLKNIYNVFSSNA